MAPSAMSNGTSTNGEHQKLDWTAFYNVIDGELTSTEKTRTGINPATSEPNDPVPVSTPDDVHKAVAAGQKAFRSWADTPWAERKKAILAFTDGIEAEKENFSKLLVKEQGKPVRQDFCKSLPNFVFHYVRCIYPCLLAR